MVDEFIYRICNICEASKNVRQGTKQCESGCTFMNSKSIERGVYKASKGAGAGWWSIAAIFELCLLILWFWFCNIDDYAKLSAIFPVPEMG